MKTQLLADKFTLLKAASDGSNPTFWVQDKQKQILIKKLLKTEAEAENELAVLQFLQGNLKNPELVPKPIFVDGQNLVFKPIMGQMIDDSLDLSDQIEKEKAFQILTKALQALKQIHQIPQSLTQKLNLKTWANKTNGITTKIEIIKKEDPKLGKVIEQNWLKLTAYFLELEDKNERLCHGDFSLAHVYYKNERLENSDSGFDSPENKKEDFEDLNFSGIIDFGDAVLASPYLDISHLILKEINKPFGFELANFVLDKYFEKRIDWQLLTYFATYYTIIRLFEFQDDAKLFAKFVEKYDKFLEFVNLRPGQNITKK